MAIKQFLEAFEVDYEIKEQNESTYNSKFVKKMVSTKNEKCTRINPDYI